VVGTTVFHLENCPMGDEIVACQNKGGEGDKDSRGVNLCFPLPPYFEALCKRCPHLRKFPGWAVLGRKHLHSWSFFLGREARG